MLVLKAIPGFEEEFNSLTAKKASLEAEKSKAIEEAVHQVEEAYAERDKKINSLLAMVSTEEEDSYIYETEEAQPEEASEEQPAEEVEISDLFPGTPVDPTPVTVEATEEAKVKAAEISQPIEINAKPGF